ncbi:hypothetical protein LEN26_004092 [Aphanomyces euteiches]|nr:hypothetical protein LEN26_004092 [Aphanomyces euteiches]KAH9184883.1 hypothetical protein AeNC1_013142 [Aphanomyces euteiches]
MQLEQGTSYKHVDSWYDLSFAVVRNKQARPILTNAIGRCAPGELTAILGPSGSGKTTLLDILADRRASGFISGKVTVNGKRRDSTTFRLMASYVAQDDSLFGSFSVLETLRYAAQLSVASIVSSFETEQRVQAAIDDMGLRSCQDTLVGDIFRKGLSGGQRRRLSIAIELLKQPTILLLDEPTSGLDSASTYNVVKYIKKLCSQNRTVVATIHQPSSIVYHMFSNIMILAKGQTVFFGPPTSALSHFANLGHRLPPFTNPGEFYLQLVNTDFDGHHDVDELIASYASSAAAAQVYEQINQDRSDLRMFEFPMDYMRELRPSAWRQMTMLMHRNSLNNIRNPGVYGIRLAMYIMLSLMVATVYIYTNKQIRDEDRAALLFYVQAFLVFMSVAVLPFFIEQRSVFNRERANNSLNVTSFVVANFLAALPGIFLIAVVATAIVVGLAGLESFWYFLLNMFLSLVVAESLMHVLGALVPHYIIGIALGAGIYGMFMLVEGFMVPFNSIPAGWQWVSYVAFHSYSFKSFMYEQFHANPDSAAILKKFGCQDVNVDQNMLILVGYAALLQLIFWVILTIWHTGRR